jgi:hypothetical protein
MRAGASRTHMPVQAALCSSQTISPPTRKAPNVRILCLSIVDINIQVHCEDTRTYQLIKINYGHMQAEVSKCDMEYNVGPNKDAKGFFISRTGESILIASDESQFLYLFEKDMTIELEKQRHDLYFIHGAALVAQERAFLLVGPSGNGKSTLAWALSHSGFAYLSDELAPIDVSTLAVSPYPHAVCLKDAPAPPYELPAEALYTTRTLHVPVHVLQGGVRTQPTPLSAIFFITYSPTAEKPVSNEISAAEATARLYTNALNPLAHPRDGLDAAAQIASAVSCLKLVSADAASTCMLVKSVFDRVVNGQPGSRIG